MTATIIPFPQPKPDTARDMWTALMTDDVPDYEADVLLNWLMGEDLTECDNDR